LLAIQWGSEVGLSPIQAINNITSINGKPCLWGDSMLALVRSSGLLEYITETVENDVGCCIIKRKGEKEITMRFSKEDAQRAGLWGRTGPWKTYPERMLKLRARGFALRDVFPDVLKGVISAEEAADIPLDNNEPKDNPTSELDNTEEDKPLEPDNKPKVPLPEPDNTGKEKPYKSSSSLMTDLLAQVFKARTMVELENAAADCKAKAKDLPETERRILRLEWRRKKDFLGPIEIK
jgi:hypothetical protein